MDNWDENRFTLRNAASHEAPEDWSETILKMPPELARMMDFLLTHLPINDIINYPVELFARFAEHALFLRENMPQCASLEYDAFTHYVLFPRVNDEDISFHRRLFYDLLAPRLAGIDDEAERVLEVNRWCNEYASYERQDERTASALTVFRCGSGRCGEESVFLVSALRSIGIASRQVYSPRWAHCDDNHAWVEVFCEGEWHFLGACEPEPILDRGWFNTSASRAILIHSRIFGPNGIHSVLGSASGSMDNTDIAKTAPEIAADEAAPPNGASIHGTFIERRGVVSLYSQTARYAPVHRRIFRAYLGGRPACGARFHIQLLNESRFYTIAVLTAGADGSAGMELGIGSIHCLAELNGACTEADIDGYEYDFILTAPKCDTGWQDFNVLAPQVSAGAQKQLTAAQQLEREHTLKRGGAIREARIAGFMPDVSGSGSAFSRCAAFLRDARGNAREILQFLRGAASGDGSCGAAADDSSERLRFLETLSQKDLRDTEASTLEALFEQRPAPREGIPETVYWNHMVSPRIANEKLTTWREPLKRALGLNADAAGETAASGMPPLLAGLLEYSASPYGLWSKLDKLIMTQREGLYSNLYCTPENVLRAGYCDERSKLVLFIAVLRTLGTPSRLREADGRPEYFEDGRFKPVFPENTGTLCIVYPKDASPQYAQNWSINCRKADGWQLLELPEPEQRSGEVEFILPEGDYRIITSTRLPNGNQFASRHEFTLHSGCEEWVELQIRSCALEDMLRSQPMPETPARTLEGEETANVFSINARPSLLIWLEEGSEPTEHVLNELLPKQAVFEDMPVNIILLVKGVQSLAQPTLARVIREWRSARVLIDNWSYDMENIARCLTCDPDTPPLIVVCDGNGNAVYGTSGYQVGSVELCLRIASYLSQAKIQAQK